MVTLIEKTRIQELNIDTVERAIIFSALALRQYIVEEDNSNSSDRSLKIDVVSKSDDVHLIEIDVSIPYSAFHFNQRGGELLSSLKEFEDDLDTFPREVEFSYLIAPSPVTQPVIPDYDANVIDTFEKYLFYYSIVLWASISENKRDTVSIQLRGTDFEGAKVRLQISLPFNFQGWLFGQPLINAVTRIVDSYTAEPTYTGSPGIITILDNDVLLDNNTLLVG